MFQILLIGKVHREVNLKELSRIITFSQEKQTKKTSSYDYNSYAMHSHKQITWLNQIDLISDHAWFES